MTIMIIHFVKDEGLPVVVWPPAHVVTISAERRSRRVKQFVSYGFVCCQENESYLTSVFPKVILSPSFCMRLTTHRSRQKNLYILQTESQSMNSFFLKKNGKLLAAI